MYTKQPKTYPSP